MIKLTYTPETVETDEAEPPSNSLDGILADLKPWADGIPEVHVSLYDYDDRFVAVWLLYADPHLKKHPIISHLALKIYSKDEILRNEIVDRDRPAEYDPMRDSLIQKGYDIPPLPEPVEEVIPEPENKSWLAGLTLFSWL